MDKSSKHVKIYVSHKNIKIFFSNGVKFSGYISRYVYRLLVGCSVHRSEVHDWLLDILKAGDNLRMSQNDVTGPAHCKSRSTILHQFKINIDDFLDILQATSNKKQQNFHRTLENFLNITFVQHLIQDTFQNARE